MVRNSYEPPRGGTDDAALSLREIGEKYGVDFATADAIAQGDYP